MMYHDHDIMMYHDNDIMMYHDFRDLDSASAQLAMSGNQQGKSEIMIRITEIRNSSQQHEIMHSAACPAGAIGDHDLSSLSLDHHDLCLS